MSTPIVATGAAVADRRAKRNVAVLVFAHAVLGSQLALNIIVAGLAGALFADDPSLATLPISIVVVGSLLSAPAMSLFMGRYGRRAGFLVGALAGGVAGLVCARAMFIGSFGLFMAGSVLLGVYQAAQGFFRFAAADTASESFKPKAISWVLAGGLLSALLGPEIVRATSGTFVRCRMRAPISPMIVLNVIGAVGLRFLDIPRPHAPPQLSTRAAARRHRPPTRVLDRGACLAMVGLRVDEPRHDVDAARDGRPRLHARSCGRRRALAHRRDVRAELLHGLGDRALRPPAGHRGRLAAARRVRRDCAQRHRSAATSTSRSSRSASAGTSRTSARRACSARRTRLPSRRRCKA